MTANRTFLEIAVEEWIPWCWVYKHDDGRVTIEGPTRIILDIFAQAMDFDYETILSEERTFGRDLPDGSWTGMIGLVHRGEAEFTLGPITVTQKRESACDMSVPLVHDYKSLLMVRPQVKSDMAGFLNPFTIEVWLLIMLSMGVISCAMMWLVWTESKLFTSPVNKNIVATSVLWMLQTLSQESSHWLPRRDGGRLLVSTWLLASLVFMSSYSGILTAMLTVPRVTIPIDSLEDLAAQSEIPWRFEAGSSMYQVFKDATDELRQFLFQHSEGVFKDCYDARAEIAGGQYVAVCDETTMRKAMSWDFSTSGKCHLYISREKIASTYSAFGFRTKSPYLPKANEIILKLRSAGMINKWLNDYITNTSECLRPPSADRSEGINSLDLAALGGPFLMLGGGLTMAAITFLCELVIGQGKDDATPESTPPPAHRRNGATQAAY